jgi:hypothetical protein
MAGWQEVLKVVGTLVLIFVVSIWGLPKLGVFFS